jgi:hypothetical protein
MAMSTNPFANSKAALVFAATTIVGALVIVGTGDSGGALDGTLERVTQQREVIAEEARDFSEERSEVIEPLDPASGWGDTGEAVFGEYGSEEAVEAEPETEPPVASRGPAPRATSATQAPIAGPVQADSPGILVPRDSEPTQAPAAPATAVVTSRTLTIEPK